MDKREKLILFCEAEIFPKFLFLSPFHHFLALGCYQKKPLPEEGEYIVRIQPFSPTQKGPWDDLSFDPYLPCQVFLDDKVFTYLTLNYDSKPSLAGSWIISELTHLPDFSNWEKKIDEFKNTDLQKVVLGRSSTSKILQRSSYKSLLEPLLSLSGTLFGYMPNQQTLFFGLTPEHLFRKEGKNLFSEAIAGTRPLGSFYKEELLESKKDLEEFRYVTNYIEEHFTSACSSWTSSSLQIKETPTVQHLHKVYQGVVKEPFSDLDFLSSFHPTPALCGIPKEKALSWIIQNEPYHRGLYGAPLGWIGKTSSELAVGIRSSLLKNNEAFFFAAAGIVKSSKAHSEWDELNHKIQLMKGLFYEEHSLLESSLSS